MVTDTVPNATKMVRLVTRSFQAVGVANGTQKIACLGEFWPDIGISATFLSGLRGSFFPCLVQKLLESRTRIFKQGSWHLGESRILPFGTPCSGQICDIVQELTT